MRERPADRQGRGSAFGLTSGRVEAFSDGVFAIAVTLLILNVQLPAVQPGHLLAALMAIWPEYATYAASFITIGIMWLNHHALFSRLAQVDRWLVLLNILLLLIIAFLPFPTDVLGKHLGPGADGQVAAMFYALASVGTALGFSGVYAYVATHPQLLARQFEAADFFAGMPWFSIGLIAYLACIPLSHWSPLAVVVVVAITALYYVIDRLPGPAADADEPLAEPATTK